MLSVSMEDSQHSPLCPLCKHMYMHAFLFQLLKSQSCLAAPEWVSEAIKFQIQINQAASYDDESYLSMLHKVSYQLN